MGLGKVGGLAVRSEAAVEADGDGGPGEAGARQLVGDPAVAGLRLIEKVVDVEGEGEGGAELVADADVGGSLP